MVLKITRDELPMEKGVYGGCLLCPPYPLLSQVNPRTYKEEGGGGQGTWLGGRVVTPPPLKGFLLLFLDDKTLAPKVFCSCSFIPGAHFDASLVMAS